jgi:hypothetical protein
MSPQEQSNIKNYLFRRIDNTKLESIIDENYRYVENEFDPDYDFHSFNYGLATIIVEDLHILDFIDLHIEKTYDKLVEYFYIILEDRTRKLYDKLTNNTNLQEQISRMKSMMGVIKEQNDLICQHCNSRTKSNIDTLSGDTKIKAIKFIDNVFNKLGKTLTITNGYRSTEEQNKLYCQGRPKDQFCVDNNLPTDGKRVTTKKGGCSKHNYKEAFDVYFTKADGNPDLGTQMTEDVAKIGEELGLEWGGRWTDFTDKPHFQSPGRLCQ